MLTLYGVAALTFMMLMYALEQRDRRFILAFGSGCLLSSAYGFLAGVWPFGVVEVIWAGIARHWQDTTENWPEMSSAAPAWFAKATIVTLHNGTAVQALW